MQKLYLIISKPRPVRHAPGVSVTDRSVHKVRAANSPERSLGTLNTATLRVSGHISKAPWPTAGTSHTGHVQLCGHGQSSSNPGSREKDLLQPGAYTAHQMLRRSECLCCVLLLLMSTFVVQTSCSSSHALLLLYSRPMLKQYCMSTTLPEAAHYGSSAAIDRRSMTSSMSPNLTASSADLNESRSIAFSAPAPTLTIRCIDKHGVRLVRLHDRSLQQRRQHSTTP